MPSKVSYTRAKKVIKKEKYNLPSERSSLLRIDEQKWEKMGRLDAKGGGSILNT